MDAQQLVQVSPEKESGLDWMYHLNEWILIYRNYNNQVSTSANDRKEQKRNKWGHYASYLSLQVDLCKNILPNSFTSLVDN